MNLFILFPPSIQLISQLLEYKFRQAIVDRTLYIIALFNSSAAKIISSYCQYNFHYYAQRLAVEPLGRLCRPRFRLIILPQRTYYRRPYAKAKSVPTAGWAGLLTFLFQKFNMQISTFFLAAIYFFLFLIIQL